MCFKTYLNHPINKKKRREKEKTRTYTSPRCNTILKLYVILVPLSLYPGVPLSFCSDENIAIKFGDKIIAIKLWG